MGPVLIYDKSVLEGLNKREAVLLEKYFYSNITSVLFLEVMADLQEPARDKDRTAEYRVSKLADKLPALNMVVNAHHERIIRAELSLGRPQRIEMKRVPLSAALPIKEVYKDGIKGLVYKPGPEDRSLMAWREGRFSEFDRLQAQAWNATQKNVDLGAISKSLRSVFFNLPKFQNIRELKDFVDGQMKFFDERQSYRLLEAMLTFFKMTPAGIKRTLDTWKACNRKLKRILRPSEIVPYSYYVFSAELFFNIGIAQELLPRSRKAKSHIDMQYIFYLPFCMSFTSSDSFHKDVVPLFLKDNQTFIDGADLKRDLKNMAEFLAAEPADHLSKTNQSYPPQLDGCVIAKDFDFHVPNWRKRAASCGGRDDVENQIILDKLKDRQAGARQTRVSPSEEMDEFAFVKIERMMTRQQMKDQFGTTDEEFDRLLQLERKEIN